MSQRKDLPPTAPGPLALVGSGEYLESMADFEGWLLDGKPQRYVQIPTAASGEGEERLEYWIDLGVRQADRLGAEAVPLVITTRAQADDPAIAAQVAGAGLIYFSGGSAERLMQVMAGTATMEAIMAEWRSGAALAGCSAGAMMMGEWVPRISLRHNPPRHGLSLLPKKGILPHFDRFLSHIPDLLRDTLSQKPNDISLIGIDEETALVHTAEGWSVHGTAKVWDIRGHHRTPFGRGEDLADFNLPEPEIDGAGHGYHAS